MHRREFLRYMAALGLAAGVGRRLVLPEEVWALESGPGPGISADEALKILRDGNARYLEGKPRYPHQGRERWALTAGQGQHPLAAMLSCSDSRVPVELIFDQGLGDLFVVRVAGNAAATDEIGSLEYAVDYLHTPLLVVLGHSQCGAVTAVLENAKLPGSIPALLAPIRAAVARARAENPGAAGEALLEAAIKDNVWQAMEDILQKSILIKAGVKAGKTKLVGAFYELDTGQVQWLGPHPNQEKLLSGKGREGPKTPARKAKKPPKPEE
ncbi:MAG: carbonic anhydrase [Desulfobaccales bacterium]|jgi:carbonic anhydrase